MELGGAEAESLEGARAEVLDEDVGGGGEAEEVVAASSVT